MIKNNLFSLIILTCITTACGSSDYAEPEKITSTEVKLNVIPAPVQTEIKQGNFTITRQTVIIIDEGNSELSWIGEYLGQLINSATWYSIPVTTSSESNNSIVLTIDSDTSRYENYEAYELTSDKNGVTIKAPTATGIFYGVQTLRQLLPPEIEHTDPTLVPQNVEWIVPAVEVKDHPRFSYRGMHLDVSRHFFPVDFVKKYIDLLAMHKMNRFHWHLTDDQGWRIEIKKYPRLTEVGAWRDSTLIGPYDSEIYDDKPHGGFYTQEEIRDVVKYAQNRQVTIIPEIELPGHSSAVLDAYPQFGCKEDGEYHIRSSWGIFDDILCPTEETFGFIEDVMIEVMDLFPSEYIHIGGDEARKVQWEESKIAQEVIKREGLKDEHELQSYFITRVEKFLNEHGRQIIGWDEILEGGLAPNATVMSWRGVEGGIAAAKQGHDVVMTPNSHLYMDRYQADPETEPLIWGGFITLEKTYSFEPIPEELSEEEEKHILGAQGNVWTEYIHSGKKVEYTAYPKTSAIAEINWSPKSKKDFNSFWIRLQRQFDRFDIMGVNAAQHYRGEIPTFNQD